MQPVGVKNDGRQPSRLASKAATRALRLANAARVELAEVVRRILDGIPASVFVWSRSGRVVRGPPIGALEYERTSPDLYSYTHSRASGYASVRDCVGARSRFQGL